MRGWMPFAVTAVFIGLAWAADRSFVAAQMEAYSSPNRSEVLIFTSLVVRVGFALLAAGLGWLVLRGPRDRLAGLVMLAVGLYFSAVLSFNALTVGPAGPPAQLPFFLDLHEGYLLRWAGTLVTLLGLVMVARPDGSTTSEPATRGPMRAWWPLVASLAVIALSYPAGVLTREAFIGAATGEVERWLLVEGLVRFATLTALMGIGWLVLRGPRSLLVSGLMAAAGLYLAVVVPLAFAWYWMGDPAAGDLREPILIPLGLDPRDRFAIGFSPLSATIITALGLAMLLWPTATQSTPGASVHDGDRRGSSEVVEA